MRLIYDGLLNSNTEKTILTFSKYTNTHVNYYYDFIDIYNAFISLRSKDRERIYKAYIDANKKNIDDIKGYYDDYLQIGSPISIYVAEKLIQKHRNEPRGISQYILQSILNIFPDNTNLCITLPKYFGKSNANTESSYWNKEWPLMHEVLKKLGNNFKIKISAVMDIFDGAYNFLKNEAKYTVNMVKLDTYEYFDTILSLAKKVKLKYTNSLILDIDDVLVDFDKDKNKVLRQSENSIDYRELAQKYLENGNFMQNYDKLISIAEKTFNTKGMNIIILSSRNYLHDKKFLNMVKNSVYKNIIRSNYRNSVFFNVQRNLIANPKDIYNGKTALKSYVVEYIANNSKNTIFIDDRIKYINSAFNVLSKNNKTNLSISPIPKANSKIYMLLSKQ